jgi:hypothetical protein
MDASQGFGMGVSLFGTLMAADQIRDLDRALRSRGWARTTGRVLATSMLHLSWQLGTAHSPAVLYEYEVAGESYQGQTINYRGSTRFGAARNTIVRYRKGTKVTVYYDPKKPYLAVLEPGADAGGLVRAVGSLGLIGLGLWLYYGGAA